DAYRHASSYLAQTGYAVMLFDPARRLLARFGRTLDLPAEQMDTTGFATVETTFEGNEEHWRISLDPVVRHDGVTVGYLAVGQSIDAVEQGQVQIVQSLLDGVDRLADREIADGHAVMPHHGVQRNAPMLLIALE